MGKGIKAKPKKKNKKVLTQWEIDRQIKKHNDEIQKKIEDANIEIDSKLDGVKDEITLDSTRIMKALDFYILIKYIGVDPEKVAEIQLKEEDVSDMITNGELDWDDIYNYLAEKELYCDGVIYENGKVVGYE